MTLLMSRTVEEEALLVVVPSSESQAVLSLVRGLVAGIDVLRTAAITLRSGVILSDVDSKDLSLVANSNSSNSFYSSVSQSVSPSLTSCDNIFFCILSETLFATREGGVKFNEDIYYYLAGDTFLNTSLIHFR